MAHTQKANQTHSSRVLARRETISAYLFMLPSLLFFVGFVLVPMGMCLVYSFLDMGIDTSAATFTGLNNYIEMVQDPTFLRSLWNTILIVIVSVPVVTAFSLWVGSAIYPMRSKMRSFFRCVFYLPVVTGSVAVTVVWKWMFNPYNGLLNQIFGTTGFDWLGDTRTAIWCIIMILFTTSIGQPIVLTWTSRWKRPPPSTAPPACRSSGRSSGPRSCPPPCTFWSSPPSTASSALR